MELDPFDLARPLAGLPNLGFPKWCAERLERASCGNFARGAGNF